MAIRLQHHTGPPAQGQQKYFSVINGIWIAVASILFYEDTQW